MIENFVSIVGAFVNDDLNVLIVDNVHQKIRRKTVTANSLRTENKFELKIQKSTTLALRHVKFHSASPLHLPLIIHKLFILQKSNK